MQSRTPVKRLEGRYQLLDIAGKGGMALVWRARSAERDHSQLVAVKRVHVDISRDPAIVQMFIEEARVGLQLSHPNIVRVLDFGVDTSGYYALVLEWVEGIDLFEYMRSFHSVRVHVPWQAVAVIGWQALQGLAAAHERVDDTGRPQPVIHRDVSPSNILIGMDGVVKLADFGLARAKDRATITFPNMIKGKLSYTAPELIRGHKADARSDLYSLGVTLWESLAARKLFHGETHVELLRAIQGGKVQALGAVRPDLPPALSSALERAIHRDRDLRFGSAREMASEFARVLRSLPEMIDADRLGASVASARKRLGTSTQTPAVSGEVRDDSFEVSVEVEVDYASSPSAQRSISAELSEPFEELAVRQAPKPHAPPTPPARKK